jgi:hypothetical protein
MNIRATGIKELSAALGSAPKDIAKAGFEQAAGAAMGVFRAAVEERTPVITGELLAALTTQIVKLDPPGVFATIFFEGNRARSCTGSNTGTGTLGTCQASKNSGP